MSIATKEQIKNGHVSHGICSACRLELSFSEVSLNGLSFGLCRGCASFVAGWLAADLEAAERRDGGDTCPGDFGVFEKRVRDGLRFLKNGLDHKQMKRVRLHRLLDYAREVMRADDTR